MTKKLTTLVITLFLMAVSITACKDKDVPQTNQKNQYTYEDMSEEEIHIKESVNGHKTDSIRFALQNLRD